jgi:hypothetical protein
VNRLSVSEQSEPAQGCGEDGEQQVASGVVHEF